MPNRAPTQTLVFDTSCLSCFARAGRLENLRKLTEGHRKVITPAVRDEVEQGVQQYASLVDILECSWLELVHGDALEELAAFSEYVRLLGCGPRDVGEAATLAWAEVHHAIAVLDDQTGVTVARLRGVSVKRTLALISTGILQKRLQEEDAVIIVDELICGGAAARLLAPAGLARSIPEVQPGALSRRLCTQLKHPQRAAASH